MALGVDAEKASGGIERCVMPRAGEEIQSAASVGFRMKHAIGGYERKSLCPGQGHEVFVAPGFSASQVALDFNKNIVLSKDRRQCSSFLRASGWQGSLRIPSSSPVKTRSPSA